jgi:predicted O-methyltransferase YrrM
MADAQARLMKLATGYVEAKILLTGAELRVFDALTPPATAVEVAERIRGNLRGTEVLLDALAAMQVLEKHGGRFSVHPEYAPFLAEDAPSHFPAMLRHRNMLFRTWADLEHRIVDQPRREGGLRASLTEREANENFIRAMFASSHQSTGRVVERVDLAGVRTLADLGGGPGHYCVEFARRSPEVRPYLVDLPLTLEVAGRVLADAPERERIGMVEWDFYNQPAPADLPRFDLVFVSQVLHAESPERNRELLARLVPLLNPGGQVVVHENLVEEDRSRPREGALSAVNMLAVTSGGRTYTEAEILSWGRAAGLQAGPGERVAERSFLVRMRKA